MSGYDADARTHADAVVAALKKRSLDAAIKRIAKGQYGHEKAAAVERFAEHGENEAILWALLRAGHLNTDDPPLWVSLADSRSTVDGDDVVTLLTGITAIEAPADPKNDLSHSVPGWHISLDTIVCEVFARDPEAIRAAIGSFSPFVERGLATVRLRFGEIERDLLPDEDWARTLARSHVARDGLGQSRKSPGMPRRQLVYWGERPADEAGCVNLWDHENNRWGEALYAYVERFTTRSEWERAVSQATDERVQRQGDVTVIGSWDAFLTAELDRLVKLSGLMRDLFTNAGPVLTARSDLASDDLLSLVSKLSAAGKERLADLAAAHALTSFASELAPVPDELRAQLRFRGYILFHLGAVTEWHGREDYLRALRALPTDVAVDHILTHLCDEDAEEAMAMGAAFLDGARGDEMWGALFKCAMRHAVDDSGDAPAPVSSGAAFTAKLGVAPAPRPERRRLEDARLVAFSLALFDDVDVPRLVSAFDDAQGKGQQYFANILAWSLVVLLARRADAGLTWSAELDRFLLSDRWDEADLRNLIRRPLDSALAGLTPERAAAVSSPSPT